MTVILTGLAMFAFIILGAVDFGGAGGPMGGGGGTFLIPLLSAAVFAGAFWIWGLQDGKGPRDAVTGALVGILIGLLPIILNSQQSGIATAAGTISDRELFELRRERSLANEIVMRAFRERGQNAFGFLLQQYQFGGSSAQEVVFKYVLNHVADERGISVSNEFIRDFLDEVSEGKLDRATFTAIRQSLQIGETEVFDLLRDELEARIALTLVNPQVDRMPEQYWRDFQKLNVRHTIEATAIPVEPFAAKAGKPSDEELRSLFDEFKNRFPAGGEPGFFQPDKVRLAWLSAEFEQVEQEVGEIPEDELKARYEERKESFYKIETLPDLDEPAAGDESKTETETPSDSEAENKPAEDAPADESPAQESAPEKPGAAPPEESSDEVTAGDPTLNNSDESEQTESADEAAAEESAPAEESKGTPNESAEESSEGEVKYRPFEDVRDEIRDILLREKTLALQRQKMEEATESVRNWRSTYDEVRAEIESRSSAFRRDNQEATDADVEAHVADLKKKLDAAALDIVKQATTYAEKSGLTFVETDLISQQELLESEDYEIGSAREPIENIDPTSQFTEPDTVATLAYRGATREFFPDEAEGQFDDTRYVYWLTEKEAAHEPTFDETGIREQVEAAWRARQGAPKAEARAKKLAELVDAAIAEKPMPEAVIDETVTGDEEGDQVSVITSIPFTWLRQSFQGMQMNPFMGPQPTVEFGVIPGIDNVDDEFMKTVAEMNVGDVQVIPNGDKSAYYVVHLKSRSPSGADDPQLEQLQQQFIREDAPFSPVFRQLASGEQQGINQRWFATFMGNYGVDLESLAQY
ncbi:MAG: hypothetical protein ACYTGL_20790 [Planctomycetota bacterium]|jgi:hypothetical protein